MVAFVGKARGEGEEQSEPNEPFGDVAERIVTVAPAPAPAPVAAGERRPPIPGGGAVDGGACEDGAVQCSEADSLAAVTK